MERKEKPAVFLDRDGTIIEDCGYLKNEGDVVFIKGAIESLTLLQRYYILFVVSNQNGVSKRIINTSDVAKVNDYIQTECVKKGVYIEEFFICPHQRSENCECIKPKPYFLQFASHKYGILLENSFVIGDHPHDIELAENAGAKGIYVLTGHGKKHLTELKHQPAQIVDSINNAAEYILSQSIKDKHL